MVSGIRGGEMPQETENNEVQETVETVESFEASEPLDQATFNSEEKVALKGSYEEAEVVETAFTEAMQSAKTPAVEALVSEVERPNPSGDGVQISGPESASGEAIMQVPGTADPDIEISEQVAIIDSNDSPRDAVDDGPRLGDDSVKIDTVPLPEDGLDGVAIIDSNDGPRSAVDDGPRLGDDSVKIDTVPLPEDGLDGVAIIDSNDGPRSAVDDGPRLDDDRVKIDTVPLPESPGSAASQTLEGDQVAIGTWPTPERTMDGVEIDPDQLIEDPDAPLQDDELMPPQDGTDMEPPAKPVEDGEAELKKDEGDVGELQLPPDWHLYTDKDGNDIIVDGDGKPVDSAPVVYNYQGKKYLTYPGDAPAVDEKGKVVNPQNLIEAPPAYEAPINDMYIHEDSDGKLVVVDKNGKPVDSPPKIVETEASGSEYPVKYLAYPDTKPPFDEKGKPTGETLNPLQYYNADIKDMYIHEGTDGKLTVVDKNGKPVDSPPKIIEAEVSSSEQPVKYLAYPDTKPPFDESGKPTGETLNSLKYYNAEIKDMYIHEGMDGKLTVVDKNGKLVDSPPMIIESEVSGSEHPVKYLAYPDTKPPFDESGKPTGETLNPLKYYNAPIQDMYIHEGMDGKLTVVDKNGKPVDSPPKVVEYDPNNDGQTIKYLAYPDTKPPFDQYGKPTGVKFNPAQHYQGATDGLYMHEDGDGKITVVDEKGQPVDSPPDIVMVKGKYYMAYPGTKEAAAIKADGTIYAKDAQEISYYKPDWWTKHVKQEQLKGA